MYDDVYMCTVDDDCIRSCGTDRPRMREWYHLHRFIQAKQSSRVIRRFQNHLDY